MSAKCQPSNGNVLSVRGAEGERFTKNDAYQGLAFSQLLCPWLMRMTMEANSTPDQFLKNWTDEGSKDGTWHGD